MLPSLRLAYDFVHSPQTKPERHAYKRQKLDAFIKTYDGISLLVNVQAAPTALINSVGPALLTGGPRVLFWAPLIGWFLGTCLAGSLAEMASV